MAERGKGGGGVIAKAYLDNFFPGSINYIFVAPKYHAALEARLHHTKDFIKKRKRDNLENLPNFTPTPLTFVLL